MLNANQANWHFIFPEFDWLVLFMLLIWMSSTQGCNKHKLYCIVRKDSKCEFIVYFSKYSTKVEKRSFCTYVNNRRMFSWQVNLYLPFVSHALCLCNMATNQQKIKVTLVLLLHACFDMTE